MTELEQLRAEVSSLRHLLALDTDKGFPRALRVVFPGLTLKGAQIVAFLYGRRGAPANAEQIHAGLYGFKADDAPKPGIIAVLVCQANKAVPELIQNTAHRGQGVQAAYVLSGGARAACDGVFGKERAA